MFPTTPVNQSSDTAWGTEPLSAPVTGFLCYQVRQDFSLPLGAGSSNR